MTDDQELVAELRNEAIGLRDYEPDEWDTEIMDAWESAGALLDRAATALSSAAVREEEIKAREEKRYRAAIGNWRVAALKAEGELVAAAVRYRAEGWDAGANWAFEEITGDRPGQFLAPGDNPYRALLDENNETQSMNHELEG